ncbi:hypothetical protein PHSY_006503 [Pseudozyma hubeiensis SY62]|uniref:Endonuclease/exonuclease/phosphatase domain-containing protein n=1 Tax=Pseudozyma hubeiensis (strain SY62) TaxID=1305764 RepID=R9PBX3_PSEHS|nr:hypothetical protein PHSY_006503 [Pseudozyma hubeiensis SY62]GAC98908.1 hypothetical protein PHSY_006503 [Pseudozyma hubeiensis SY62]
MTESTAAGNATAGSAPAKKTKQNNRPSPEEIEAKRRERAAKKEKEAAEKAAKEAELAAAIAANGKIPNGHLDEHGNALFVPRDWASVAGSTDSQSDNKSTRQKVRIVSWNILAQGLVRRTLFPGSDCLKFKDRSIGLTAELSSRTGHGWDVGCFQEVDRMDVHGETMTKDGFSYVYEKGYRQKQHGLLVAWRRDLFGESAHRRLTLDLDAESVAAAGEPIRTACSRVTRNVGLIVALRASATATSSPGLIVATTHLFWHPMHAYERARQSGILVRKLQEFRNELGEEWQSAPCILAGDFNDQPHSATYHLLTGRELTQHCHDEVACSSVVHKSIDERRERGGTSNGFAPGTTEPAREAPANKNVPAMSEVFDNLQKQEQTNGEDAADEESDVEEAEEEDEEEGGEPDDRMLKNCRAATRDDALLSIDELLQLHDVGRPRPASVPAQPASEASGRKGEPRSHLGSAYGLHYGNVHDPSEEGNFFGSSARGRERWDDQEWTPDTPNCHTGDSTEPMWTIFSSLFSLTLDYIFMLPRHSKQGQASSASEPYPTVTRLLRTHRTETLQPGVPRKGVCASDHIAIGAEIDL